MSLPEARSALSPAKLYLIPTPIHADSGMRDILPGVCQVLSQLRLFIVEEERSACYFIKCTCENFPFADAHFFVYDEHSSPSQARDIMSQIGRRDCGLISEAGAPCIADPGAEIVRIAHELLFDVIPLVGPSAITLALMASGLQGQRFCFHGYLSRDKAERIRQLKTLETQSLRENQTQIFMEAPYRNDQVLSDILQCLHPKTWLCLACNLSSSEPLIKTMPIELWRKNHVTLNKKPTLFLLEKKNRYADSR